MHTSRAMPHSTPLLIIILPGQTYGAWSGQRCGQTMPKFFEIFNAYIKQDGDSLGNIHGNNNINNNEQLHEFLHAVASL